MVTCQSAKLKTPAKVSWAFKMVSQFGSLGYTITGKTADLTVVQKTINDTLHKEGKPQTYISKEAGCSQSAVSKHVNRELSGREKVWKKKLHNQPRGPQSYEDCQAKSIQEFGWTSQGMDWHQEPPHTDVSRNLATIVIRSVLPGLRKRRTGLLPSGPKSSFQMRASFLFHLETKVLESGGRAEKLIAQVAWSPVWSFHSLWWFGVQCHLLVLVHCVFWKPTSLHPFTKKFWSTSFFLLLTSFFKDADFIFQQDLAPAHTAKSTKTWLNDHGPRRWCAWLASKLTRPESHSESMGYWQEENEKQETKNVDELKATVKETWASISPQQCHKLITSMPRRTEAVIKAKEAPTKYWVHLQ